MDYDLFDAPATEEQLKGYCDLDLTHDERVMSHIVAKKIPYHEFLHVVEASPTLSVGQVLADCYDDIITEYI